MVEVCRLPSALLWKRCRGGVVVEACHAAGQQRAIGRGVVEFPTDRLPTSECHLKAVAGSANSRPLRNRPVLARPVLARPVLARSDLACSDLVSCRPDHNGLIVTESVSWWMGFMLDFEANVLLKQNEFPGRKGRLRRSRRGTRLNCAGRPIESLRARRRRPVEANRQPFADQVP